MSSLFQRDDLVVPGEVPAIVLRDYQEKALAAVLAAKDRGLHRVMVVMPTGTGKTTLFAALVREFDQQYNEPALVVAHRMELLQQAAARISRVAPWISVGIEGGERHAVPESRSVCAGVQTLGRPSSQRLNWFRPGLVILDEGHHAPADTWQNVMRRFGCYDGVCFTLAVTATDHRMDNKPLHGSEEAIFEDVVFRYPLRQAVADGWLVDLRGYRVATGTDLSKVRTTAGDYNQAQLARVVNTEERNTVAIGHWEEVASDRRTIVFCVDVQHAKDVAAMFRARGVRAEHVDGTMKTDDREGVLARFGSGATQVLSNVDVATEGFDIPSADCVLMLRPTQSWALYTQMAGRGVRTLPGVVDGVPLPDLRRKAIQQSAKPDCIVIDVVDLSTKFGLATPPEEGADPGKSKAPATAAGLLGLPPDFDLEGHSLFETAQKVEGLDPVRRAEMFRRPMTFGELSTVLSEVDLIKELSIPEEVLAVSRLAWMKTGDMEYYLPCGSSAMEKERSARLVCDELGRYSVVLWSELLGEMRSPVGTSLTRAFDEADRIVRMTYPDCGPIVRADSSWRDRPPSEKQLEALRAMNVEERTIELIETMGQARALIEKTKLARRRRPR